MAIIDIYVATEREAKAYRELLADLGIDALVTVVDDVGMRLPAIRTTNNLYEGEFIVGRLLSQFAERRSAVRAAV